MTYEKMISSDLPQDHADALVALLKQPPPVSADKLSALLSFDAPRLFHTLRSLQQSRHIKKLELAADNTAQVVLTQRGVRVGAVLCAIKAGVITPESLKQVMERG